MHCRWRWIASTRTINQSLIVTNAGVSGKKSEHTYVERNGPERLGFRHVRLKPTGARFVHRSGKYQFAIGKS